MCLGFLEVLFILPLKSVFTISVFATEHSFELQKKHCLRLEIRLKDRNGKYEPVLHGTGKLGPVQVRSIQSDGSNLNQHSWGDSSDLRDSSRSNYHSLDDIVLRTKRWSKIKSKPLGLATILATERRLDIKLYT